MTELIQRTGLVNTEMLSEAWWLIRQIGDALYYFWPISLILLLLSALSVILGRRDRSFVAVSTRLLVVLAIVVTAFVVLSLVLWRDPALHPNEPMAWGAYVVTVLFLAHVMITVWIVARSRSRLCRVTCQPITDQLLMCGLPRPFRPHDRGRVVTRGIGLRSHPGLESPGPLGRMGSPGRIDTRSASLARNDRECLDLENCQAAAICGRSS